MSIFSVDTGNFFLMKLSNVSALIKNIRDYSILDFSQVADNQSNI